MHSLRVPIFKEYTITAQCAHQVYDYALGKRNEIKQFNPASRIQSNIFPHIFWLYIFWAINGLCITIPFGVWSKSLIAYISTSCILLILFSLFIPLIRKIDRPYHLYDAKVLLLPGLFFALGWASINWLNTPSLFLFFITLLTVFLTISFNSVLLEIFGIDIYKHILTSTIRYIKEFIFGDSDTDDTASDQEESLLQWIRDAKKNEGSKDI